MQVIKVSITNIESNEHQLPLIQWPEDTTSLLYLSESNHNETPEKPKFKKFYKILALYSSKISRS